MRRLARTSLPTTPSIIKKIVAFSTLALISTSSFSEEADAVFQVCADPNNPPYSDKDGNGFENKIAELFAEELGMSVEYTWFPQRMGFVRNTLKATKPNSEEYKCDVIMGVPAEYDMTWTTNPYYVSTYALLIPDSEEWQDIKKPADLDNLSDEQKQKLKIALFDRGPGTEWIFNHGLIKQGVPYQTMSGDAAVNTAQKIAKDMSDETIDMAILWGPMAAYVATEGNTNKKVRLLPMSDEDGAKFEFPMAMGIRYGDKERKAQLNELIKNKSGEIKVILDEYRIPRVEN